VVCSQLAGSGQNRTQAAVVRSGWYIVSDEGRETVRTRVAPARIVLPIGDLLSAIIVALVPATARSCHAPSVERRGSWILELHAPDDARAMPSLPNRRRLTSCGA
jgi:hypothetical protein